MPILFCLGLRGSASLDAEVDTVQKLIRAVDEGSPGDTVRVAAGTFELTSPLVPRRDMTIRGAGSGKTIITSATDWKPGMEGLPKKENPQTGAPQGLTEPLRFDCGVDG